MNFNRLNYQHHCPLCRRAGQEVLHKKWMGPSKHRLIYCCLRKGCRGYGEPVRKLWDQYERRSK